MLFNSYAFVLIFLPAVLGGYALLQRRNDPRLSLAWLTTASAVFFASAAPRHLWVPAASLAFNFALGRLLTSRRCSSHVATALFITGVIANVLFLAAFKATISPWFGGVTRTAYSTATEVLIPLGISFITFQQIAFLRDCRRGRLGSPRLGEYLFFILFFPQLLIGPIVHYREIAPQLRDSRFGRLFATDIAVGLAIFVVGLFKKVVIADTLAADVDPAFAHLADHGSIASLDAWAAALGFTLQIYFDFSGYADMAIGLGRMFGIRLPINFDAPYKAADRFDLWRRWHISFTVFMRQHVFVPLVRNRRFPLPVPLALFVTTLLAGLWHGLGTTFALWGLLQGLLLLVRHGSSALRRRLPRLPQLPKPAGVLVTFGVTVLVGVLFRAADFEDALTVYRSLAGFSGGALAARPHALEADPAAGFALDHARFALLAAALAIVWLLPTTQQLFGRYWNALDQRAERPAASPVPRFLPCFELSAGWAALIGVLAVTALLLMNRPLRFVYYQF